MDSTTLAQLDTALVCIAVLGPPALFGIAVLVSDWRRARRTGDLIARVRADEREKVLAEGASIARGMVAQAVREERERMALDLRQWADQLREQDVPTYWIFRAAERIIARQSRDRHPSSWENQR